MIKREDSGSPASAATSMAAAAASFAAMLSPWPQNTGGVQGKGTQCEYFASVRGNAKGNRSHNGIHTDHGSSVRQYNKASVKVAVYKMHPTKQALLAMVVSQLDPS